MLTIAAAILAAAFVCLGVVAPVGASEPTPKLAVLIAAPWPGELSMSQDVVAASLALRRRGFAADQIMILDGQQTRDSILRLLAAARQRISEWTSGDVIMAVAAHGSFTGLKVMDARPALLLSTREPLADQMLFWDEIFNTLAIPAGVRLVLLPDA
jgi:hypothetical protein